VKSATSVLPVTSGISLIGQVMFRGAVVVTWQPVVLAALALGFTAVAWVLIRRAMRGA
jgi:hypothetical protein